MAEFIGIGGLWGRKSKAGKAYWSGTFRRDDIAKIPAADKVVLMVFPNDRKEKESDPDFRLVAKEHEERGRW